MATTAIYGKLDKPELGGGKLVVQAGILDFGASATISANLTSPIGTVLFAGFQAMPGQVVGKAMPPTATAGTAGDNKIVVNRLSAGARYFKYCVIGY